MHEPSSNYYAQVLITTNIYFRVWSQVAGHVDSATFLKLSQYCLKLSVAFPKLVETAEKPSKILWLRSIWAPHWHKQRLRHSATFWWPEKTLWSTILHCTCTCKHPDCAHQERHDVKRPKTGSEGPLISTHFGRFRRSRLVCHIPLQRHVQRLQSGAAQLYGLTDCFAETMNFDRHVLILAC